MDDLVYNLTLRSRTGLTLFGVLRYRLTGFEVDGAAADRILSRPAMRDPRPAAAQTGQQDNIFAIVYRAEGVITIPLLTGLQAVPVADVAFYIQMGPPLLTRMASNSRRLLMAFNQVDNRQIGGHLLWQPANTTFGLLGRRAMLSA